MNAADLIACARGEKPADLLLANARIVNVFSGEILSGNVGVKEGVILGTGDYRAQETVDLGGRFLAPGFIDAHVHIESSMASVPEFVRAVVPHGTTTVVADPHEIANVMGMAGIRCLIDQAADVSANVYFSLPSCVPATHLETAGARLSAQDLSALAAHPRVVALGEMMNVPGVLSGDPDVLEKLDMMRRRRKVRDGHAPRLSGKALNAYLAAGITSDHECADFQEAREKLRSGMHIMIREATGAKNLAALLPLVTHDTARRLMWCTDDRHPHDLLDRGSVDDLVRKAVRAGLDPVIAIRMATLHAAEYFGLGHLGGIAPGRQADIVVFSDLADPVIEVVYHRGIKVAEGGRMVAEEKPLADQAPVNTVNLASACLDFTVPAAGDMLRVMEIVPDQLFTKQRRMRATVRGGAVVSVPEQDLLKIVVVERHRGTGNVGKGFVTGLGLRRGAVATSVAHDAHNIVAVGVNDDDMRVAVEKLAAMGGGLAVACDGAVTASLALPTAGLMSSQPVRRLRERLDRLTAAARALGAAAGDPFMVLSFLALPVIPELKITDRGLVDVAAFRLVPLFD